MKEDIAVIALANRVLDRPNADPDDDLAVLARQLLRRQERIELAGAALELLSRNTYPDRPGWFFITQSTVDMVRTALAKIKP